MIRTHTGYCVVILPVHRRLRQHAATAQVVLLDAVTLKPVGQPLYTSKPLGAYQYSPFAGFSPPIHVNVQGLHVSTDAPLELAIAVTNSNRQCLSAGQSKKGLPKRIHVPPARVLMALLRGGGLLKCVLQDLFI
jgi:hypothetical protein